MLKLIVFIGVLSFLNKEVYAQFRVLSGTNVTIDSATTVNLDLSGQNFILDSTTLVTNNGCIVLADSTSLSEQPGYPIVGNGYETTTRNLNQQLFGANIGGLGFYSLTDSIPGVLTIKRFHTAENLSTLGQSIKRRFVLSSTDTLAHNYTFGFLYDPTELNGNIPSNLIVINKSDTSGSWYGLGGTSFANLYKTEVSTDNLGEFTLIGTSLTISTVNDTSFCPLDSIITAFNAQGFFNSDNVFICEISDASGSFVSVVSDDTLTSDLFNFINIYENSFAPSNFYKLRIRSTSPALYSLDTVLHLHSNPLISINNLLDSYCLNLDPQNIGTSPLGGTFNVSFLNQDTIFPSLASSGTFNIEYIYSNSFGCTSIYYDTVIFYAPPSIPVITQNFDTLTSSISSNIQWYLNGSPIAGATNEYLIPTSNGIYEVEHFDTNGCSVFSDTLLFNTLGLPGFDETIAYRIYPNPVTSGENLFLSYDQNTPIKRLIILSVDGKLMYHSNDYSVLNNNIVLNVSILPNGQYLLCTETETKTNYIPFVVVK